MKRKIWFQHLLGALFAFALSVSTAGCLATGFQMNVASMGRLILCCGIISLLSALLLRFKFGGIAVLSLSALAAVIVWRHGALWEQLQTLLLTVTTQYHVVYNWPAIGRFAAEEVDLALMAVAWWTAVSVSFCVCRRGHILTALPSVALPLVACLIVTNTVPDEIYLFLLILGVSLLLLTDWVRRNDPARSVSLTLRMAIPVAAALALLFTLNPREGYVNQAAKLQKEVVNWFQQLQSLPGDITIGGGTEAAITDRLNLRNVGPKNRLDYSVMRVRSPIDGTLYLRGRDYDVYTGTGWEATADRSETFPGGRYSQGQLTITTYGTRNIRYIPYYAADSITLSGGSVDNAENLTRYSYDLASTPTHDFSFPDPRYVLLTEETTSWASPLVQEITADCAGVNDQVQAIGSYVRDCASYDLDTSRMSTDYIDFAQWFLEESDTGYCVHFATAATVLLRAAQIPARYVEGYMVTGHTGADTVVSSQDAHAWCEYFDYDSGAWMILEATPADVNSDETEPSNAPIPESSEAPETAPDPTQPSAEEETAPSNEPGGNAGLPDAVVFTDGPFRLPGWVKGLLWIILAAAAIILQGELRISRKRRRWNRGKPNEMALTRWKQSEELSRLLKIALPEELDQLAQKAKFSQHTLTREELQQFEHFRRDALRTLNTLPPYRKWFLRWILAIG